MATNVSGFQSVEHLKIQGAFNKKITELSDENKLKPGMQVALLAAKQTRSSGIMVSVRLLEDDSLHTILLNRIDLDVKAKKQLEVFLNPDPTLVERRVTERPYQRSY